MARLVSLDWIVTRGVLYNVRRSMELCSIYVTENVIFLGGYDRL